MKHWLQRKKNYQENSKMTDAQNVTIVIVLVYNKCHHEIISKID